MKASSAIGLVVAIVGLYLGATMEGSNPMAILSPSAMLIVLGGTLGAVIIGTSFASITNIPKMYMKSFNPPQHDLNAKVAELVGYAEAARRDGLLALDEVTSTIEDPYTRKGLQLVVDGTDPDLVADILESENEAMRKRHAASVQPFDKADDVVAAIQQWRSSILAGAMPSSKRRVNDAGLTLVAATAATPPTDQEESDR